MTRRTLARAVSVALSLSIGARALSAQLTSGQPMPLASRPALTILTPAPGPAVTSPNRTPAFIALSWSVPQPATGMYYSVQRWLDSDFACCYAEVNSLTSASWTDEGTQWPGVYVYRITAFYPGGRVGASDVRISRPAPENPSRFRATVGTNSVSLQWDPVWKVSWYELSGPALPTAPRTDIQLTGITSFVIRNLTPGTYTWRIGSFYSSPNAPAPVSTARSQFPQVSVVIP